MLIKLRELFGLLHKLLRVIYKLTKLLVPQLSICQQFSLSNKFKYLSMRHYILVFSEIHFMHGSTILG